MISIRFLTMPQVLVLLPSTTARAEDVAQRKRLVQYRNQPG
jgi:hypothetical protein